MTNSSLRKPLGKRFAYASMLLLGMVATGCQVTVGGQTLPSGYIFDGRGDDVQYFAPGPQFQLANEAAAQNLRRAEVQQQQLNH